MYSEFAYSQDSTEAVFRNLNPFKRINTNFYKLPFRSDLNTIPDFWGKLIFPLERAV